MLKSWAIDGKSGEIQFPKGEVVTQTMGIQIMPIYVTSDNKHYIEVDGKLQWVLMNPFNGYCYRQDGL